MKFLTFLKRIALKKTVVYALGAALVLGIGFRVFGNGNENGGPETLLVELGTFVRDVSVSGKVVAAKEAKLAFSESGRVSTMNADVGDYVGAGAVLGTLAIDTLLADLRAAEADLEKARKEQDTLVESTYRTLLSDDLAAVPDSSNYSVTVPTVTGLYTGPEGTYKVRVVQNDSSNLNDYELRVFGLEQVGDVEILEDEATALGTKGLFLSFSDELGSYSDTTWYVAIPNVKSTSYLANHNAYQEALRTREKVLTAAEKKIDGLKTDIAERTLRAPFSGVVTAVDIEVGEIAQANETALSLINAGVLQIESFVPEINISLLKVGAPAVITLDAYGATVPFEATIVSIDPAETVRDGVSTYRAILQFSKQDDRIRSGMTANIVVTADRREGVIAIPQRLVANRAGKEFVQVLVGEGVEEREVTTGSVSSFGSVEILTGLSAGDVILLSE